MVNIYRITVRLMFLLALFSFILFIPDKSFAVAPSPEAGELKALLKAGTVPAVGLSKGEVIRKTQKLQMPFIKNEGQVDENIRFYSKTFGGTVSVTKNGDIVYSLPKRSLKKALKRKSPAEGELKAPTVAKAENSKDKAIALKETLIGGKVSEIKGEGRAVTNVSYFSGNDRSKWKSNVPTFDFVNFGEVYNGIGLKLKAYGKNVEKLFFVKPGADYSDIKLVMEGAKGMTVSARGELVVETELGPVKFTKPVAYQEINGKRVEVEVVYNIASAFPNFHTSAHMYSFKIGDYDKTRELIIDPLLASTYLGGTGEDYVNGMAVGTDGVYVTGYTSSPGLATTGVYDNTCGTSGTDDCNFDGTNNFEDAFVAKLSLDLKTLLAFTYLGGSGDDQSNAIAIDAGGYVYIAGQTNSADLPERGVSAYTAGNDTFVTKLNSSLTIVSKSTYIGGSNNDNIWSIAFDGDGNVYVAGETNSYASLDPILSGLPESTNTYTAGAGAENDAFVTKLSSGLVISASTYIGGSDSDFGNAVAVDGSDVYVVGMTISTDLAGANNAKGASGDAFVAKLDSNLTPGSVVSRYIGGSGDEGARTIVVSGATIYIAGQTNSVDFPSRGASSYSGAEDVFVSKLATNLLSDPADSKYFGGANTETINSMVLSGGYIYIGGGTSSSPGLATSGAYNETYAGGSSDIFIAKFNATTFELSAATYIGSSAADIGGFIALDSAGDVYVAGYTGSDAFPTIAGAYDTSHNGLNDVFISKLDASLAAPFISTDPLAPEFGTVDVGSGGTSIYLYIIAGKVLDVATIEITGDASFSLPDGVSGECAVGAPTFTLAKDATCALNIKFDPGSKGGKTATLRITSNGSDGGILDVTLNGTGLQYTLTAQKDGTGTGTVTSTDINCGFTCTKDYNLNAPITLAAAAGDGSTFMGWTTSPAGKCTGTGDCSFSITANTTVTATFTLTPVNGTCGSSNGQTLTVIPSTNLCSTGTASAVSGSGPWTWSCAGANDGTTASCSAAKAAAINGACGSSDGQALTAAPAANLCNSGTASSVSGSGPWTWSCAGANGGTTASCTASKQAEVVTAVNGACGASDGQTLIVAPTANLCSAGTADTVSGSGPWTWSCAGAGSGTTATCTANKQAEVATPVNGACGPSDGQTLMSVPATDLCSSGTASSVSGSGPWTWSCAGADGGTTASCSAILQTYALTVTMSGSGVGAVTSNPSGINCGTDCTETYNAGTEVILTATADSGSTFAGWSGGSCYGTDECFVTMNGNEAISATFTQDAPAGKFNLTVIMDGAGSGEVAVSKGTMECSDNVCTATFDEGTSVTLTAKPGQESLFSAWDGCDSAKAKCTLSLDDNKVVMVTFIPFPKLTVTVISSESEYGTGTGKVVAAGIKCGNADETADTNCEQTYSKEVTVKLKAVPDKGSAFSGWEGCDSEADNACTVTVGDEGREVTATFEPTPRYAVAVMKDGNGSGRVTSSQKGIDGTGINCDASDTDCESAYLKGATITVTAKADKNGSKFTGWSGYAACEGKASATCKILKIEAGVNLTATFIKPYNISGNVKDVAGNPVKGAVVTLGGDGIADKTVRSNTKGVYTFKGIAPGSYTASASKNGYTFEDISLTVADSNLTGQDLTGSK